MTNADYMRLMNQWAHSAHSAAFVAAPHVNAFPQAGATTSLRCCFSDDTPNHLQLWFTFGVVDQDTVDDLVEVMEANDVIDAQADGLGYFGCLTEAGVDHFAWVVRMPFNPATSVNDLQRAMTQGRAHAIARWNAALPA
jgi:hypothetical protein